MVKLYSVITALLLAVGLVSATNTAGYEWWLDNDLSTLQTGQVSDGRIELPIALPPLSKGVHYFNCRLKTTDGLYGSIYRKAFFNFEDSDKNRAVGYEYWFDDSRDAKASGAINGNASSIMVDVPNLQEGFHYFNYRLCTSEGEWGSVYREPFFKLGDLSQSQGVRYLYWFDNAYDERRVGNLTSGGAVFGIDLSDMKPGVHYFNCRVESSDGSSGSIYRKFFILQNEPSLAKSYEYWFDNDYASKKSGILEGRIVNLDLDLADLDKTKPVHFFNFRLQNTDNSWGAVYRKAIICNNPELNRKILGYREYLNNQYIGYKSLENNIDGFYSFSIDLPEDLTTGLKDHQLIFEGDRVSVSWKDPIQYILQLESERGWVPPCIWEFEVAHDFSTVAEEMQVNSTRVFTSPKKNEFAAVKFTASAGPLHFSADRKVALDLYRNGQKVKEIPANEITEMATVEVSAGEYFGIFHDVEGNATGEFSFTLMDRLEGLLAPEIAYNGRYLTLTSDMPEAKIYYTLDGSDPLTGTLYEGELDTEGLGQVRAVTVRDGYFDSETSEYEIYVYANDEFGMTARPGVLAEGFGWNGEMYKDYTDYTISGFLDENDYAFVRTMKSLTRLDLENASTYAMDVEPFAGLGLVSVSLPKEIEKYTTPMFAGNRNLCAIKWNSSLEVLQIVEGADNPNLLLYVPENTNVAWDCDIRNVIVNGVADNIRLSDGYPFFAPESFTTSVISYTRHFTKSTEIGLCTGWETLALPFEVSEIRDSRGIIEPFAKEIPDSRPFWLYLPTAGGWEHCDRIEAYKPYIISMPNNPDYIDKYNITGDVVFTGYGVTVAETPEVPLFPYRSGYLSPYYSILDYSANSWVINDDWYEGYAPGSRFVAGLRDVRPFEGYLNYDSAMHSIPVFGGSGLENPGTDGVRIWKEQERICIYSPIGQRFTIYDTMGRIIRVEEVEAGETRCIDGLIPGIYIIANTKIKL